METLNERIDNAVSRQVAKGAYSIDVVFADDVVRVKTYRDHDFSTTFIEPHVAGESYDPDSDAVDFAGRQAPGGGMGIYRRGRATEIRRLPRPAAEA